MISKCRFLSTFIANFKSHSSASPTPSPTLTGATKNAPSHDPHRQSHSFPYLGGLRASLPETGFTNLVDSCSTHSFSSHALKISAKLGFLHGGKQLHAHVIKLGNCNLLSLQNQVLHVYVKCKEFNDVCKMFDEMPLKNVVSWNTLICGVVEGNCKFALVRLGFHYFRQMVLEMMAPNCITLNGLLRASIELNDVGICRQLHCFILKSGFDSNCFVGSALVDSYAKFGLVDEAQSAFDEVLSRDLVLWNVMVSCYALNGVQGKAFGVFKLMRLEGVKGDKFTFTSMINSCGVLGSCGLGKQVHGLIIRLSFDLDVLVASALVDMYSKNENIEDARKAFDGMLVKNIVSWTTMVVGYGQHGDGKEAMRLLQEMIRVYTYPDELALASILSSCGNLSATSEVVQVHAYVVENGFEAFLSIANALVSAYSKCGSIGSAFQSFSSVAEPDIISWTSLMGAYAFHGLSKQGVDVFEKILSSNVRPDKVAFLGVLSACAHGGFVLEGLHYFNLMINVYQIMPDSEHYTSIIDLLGRAGFLDEAVNLLTSMPVEPRSDTLGAFLGACKVHRNVGLARWASEKLFVMEPNEPGKYSLMSNMYASVGHWFDVARVRKLMRERCDFKVPGCSWMETAGEVHTFVSRDKTHPRAVQVYGMLDLLVRLMKEEDDVSDMGVPVESFGI